MHFKKSIFLYGYAPVIGPTHQKMKFLVASI